MISNAHIPGFIRKQDIITDVNLRVAQHSQQIIIKRLETCKTDVAILPYTHELDRISTIHQLVDDQFILLLSSSREIPSMKYFQKWATLQKWILPDRNDITHHQIKSWLRQENVECNTTMEIPNFDLINHLAALGHGVTILPQRSLRLFYNKKLLRAIKLDATYSRKIAIVSPLEAPKTAKIHHFLKSTIFS